MMPELEDYVDGACDFLAVTGDGNIFAEDCRGMADRLRRGCKIVWTEGIGFNALQTKFRGLCNSEFLRVVIAPPSS
jgi:hypothetical protein